MGCGEVACGLGVGGVTGCGVVTVGVVGLVGPGDVGVPEAVLPVVVTVGFGPGVPVDTTGPVEPGSATCLVTADSSIGLGGGVVPGVLVTLLAGVLPSLLVGALVALTGEVSPGVGWSTGSGMLSVSGGPPG